MDEQVQRTLAERLRAELPGLIADEAERAAADAELAAALATPEGQGKQALRGALGARAETRAWVRAQVGDHDRVRLVEMAGLQTAPLGIRFVCPHEDYDYVRANRGDVVPECPEHHVPLVRAQG